MVKVITQLQLVLLQLTNHLTDSKTLQSVSIIHLHSKNKSLLSTYFLDDDNRIILQPLSGCADCSRDYINASYVDVS